MYIFFFFLIIKLISNIVLNILKIFKLNGVILMILSIDKSTTIDLVLVVVIDF